MAWVPLIDISEHQGTANFATTRAKGISYLILRVSHGLTLDRRVDAYYRAALAVGYEPWQIGFYSFINPKRGSGAATARFAADHIRRITGRTDVLYMLDVESYVNESPNVGSSPVFGPAFATWLREHRATFLAAMPGCRVIGYSNRAYWDSAFGPRDPGLAASLDWIVPRYPNDSTADYLARGYPPVPSLWDAYAFRLAPGPYPPYGAVRWDGWQFSAGYNRQGFVYGFQSSDLDLNIASDLAIARWFVKPADPITPIPPPAIPLPLKEPDMYVPIDGVRMYDTRSSRPIPGGSDDPLVLAAPANVPSDATGLALNLTFLGSMSNGFATLWSGEGPQPQVSQVNWKAGGDQESAFTIVRLSIADTFAIKANVEAQMLIDCVGYTMPGAAVDPVTQAEIVAAVVAALTD